MPIEGMKQRRQFKKIGRIGLGIKVPVIDKNTKQPKIGKDGEPVTRPQATDHFIVPEEIQSLYEEKPTRLPIFFLMDSDEDVFPHNLMRYGGNGNLVCMGDGRRVLFRRHIDVKKHETSTLIYGGVARWEQIEANGVAKLWEGGGGYGTLEPEGNSVKCLHMECPQSVKRYCKPTGMLRFAIKEIIRQGFWQLTIHLNPMDQILGQLQHGREFIEQYLGRPTIMHADWILELMGPEKKWINGRLLDVYTPELELDPAWMKRAMEGKVKLPHVPQVTTEDVFGSPMAIEEPVMDKELLEALPFEPHQDEDEEEATAG